MIPAEWWAAIQPGRGLRLIFGTSHGTRIFLANLLAAFGLTSAVIQFVGQLFPRAITRPTIVMLGAFLLCTAWGLFRAHPRRRVRREFTQPDVAVTVEAGDLFDQDAHIAVGFSDTFDTSIAGDRVVSASSVQGQLLRRRYGGDQRRLDRDLASALAGITPAAVESRRDKPLGKLRRYPLGTVAVIGQNQRLIFAVAYSRMGNDLVARSGVDELWAGLSALWDAIYSHGQHRCVAIPLFGSGLARVDLLERQNLLRMILLSFLARSRSAVVCRELRIVLRPLDMQKIDMLEVKAFLGSL